MKKKLDKATRKKIILAVVIIAGLICGYKIIDAASYQFVKTKAEIYLCIKYDAKPSEIELVDYKHSGIYWDDYNIFYLTPKWTDFSFEFKYNDRNFIVNREKGRFYDDYQLDEIEKWCTDWLKENVDDKIIGLWADSYNIFCYQKNMKINYYHLFTEKDVKDYILFSHKSKDDTVIVYNAPNLLRDNYEKTEKQILEKLYNQISYSDSSHSNRIDIYFTEKDQMCKYTFKNGNYRWLNEYTEQRF